MLTPCCQGGIRNVALMPPPLPDHAASEDHAPPGPAVVRDVPPTTVIFGSSDGAGMAPG